MTQLPAEFKGVKRIIAEALLSGSSDEEAKLKANTSLGYTRKVKSELTKRGLLARGSRKTDISYSGELASKLFKTFREGKSTADAVIEHKLPYTVVQKHHTEFLDSKNVTEANITKVLKYTHLLEQIQYFADDLGVYKMGTCTWSENDEEDGDREYCRKWTTKHPRALQTLGYDFKKFPDGTYMINPDGVLCMLCPHYERSTDPAVIRAHERIC